MSAKEKLSMNNMVRTAMLGAGASMGFMVLLMLVLADQLARQVIRPVGRFIRYVGRIAEGDFSPIRPTRPLDPPAGLGSPTLTSSPSSRQAAELPATGRSATALHAVIGRPPISLPKPSLLEAPPNLHRLLPDRFRSPPPRPYKRRCEHPLHTL